MKRSYQRYYARKMRRDTLILLTPIILTVIAILWALKDESSAVREIVLFIDSLLY